MRASLEPFRPWGKSEVLKLTEVIKAHLVDDARAFVRRAEGAPVLMAYNNDGAPLTVKKHDRAKLSGSNLKVRREGASTSEFLVHQEYLRYYDPQRSAPDSRVLLRGPQPLTHGKKAWAIFQSGMEFMKTPCGLGHAGIAVCNFSFDRALYEPFVLHFNQHFSVRQRQAAALVDPDSGAVGPMLCAWVLPTARANHDCQTALKWAMQYQFEDPQLMKDHQEGASVAGGEGFCH